MNKKFNLYSTVRMVIVMCLPIAFVGLGYTGQSTWELSETGLLVIGFSILDILIGGIMILHWIITRKK